MIKRLIFSIVFTMVLLGGLSIFETSYNVVVSNEVAVSQVEDSDEAFIAMQHVDAPKTAVNLIVLSVLLGGLWLTWSRPIKSGVQYIKENC